MVGCGGVTCVRLSVCGETADGCLLYRVGAVLLSERNRNTISD